MLLLACTSFSWKKLLKKFCSWVMRLFRNSLLVLPKAFFGGKFGNPLYVFKLNYFLKSDWKFLMEEYLSLIWKIIFPGATTLMR